MCTAATYHGKDFYFGRTLDNDFSYREEVVVLPRNYPLTYLEQTTQAHHYAIIGMASVIEDAPLFYDAVNERGLAIAGLNFVGNACYHPHVDGRDNIAQFELIPWLLGQCASVQEARGLLERLNLLDTPFHPQLPLAQLHWLLSDGQQTITVESVADGLKIYENPIGILTNNPPFPQQMQNLVNYRHLSPSPTGTTFAPDLDLPEYSRGMGAIGLPGDLSSQSRFVRAAFTKLNACAGGSETESVGQFFHILGSVDQQKGCCRLRSGGYEITIYTSCCNTRRGIYYYTTYGNHQITGVDMHREDLDGADLIRYPISQEQALCMRN